MYVVVGDVRSNMSEEDDEDFYDAMSEQTEEIKITLPSSDKKVHQSVHFLYILEQTNCIIVLQSENKASYHHRCIMVDVYVVT